MICIECVLHEPITDDSCYSIKAIYIQLYLHIYLQVKWNQRLLRIAGQHRWARYFKKVAERAQNAKKNFKSAIALQGL